MDEWKHHREDEGFAELTDIKNGYGKLDNGNHLYGGYIYDMVTLNNIEYKNVYVDGGFIAASCNSPFIELIEKQQWYCFAIIDPYGEKGKPLLRHVQSGFLFKFKEVETKLWDKRQEIKFKQSELIRIKSDDTLISAKILTLRNEIRWLENDIDKYQKAIGEV